MISTIDYLHSAKICQNVNDKVLNKRGFPEPFGQPLLYIFHNYRTNNKIKYLATPGYINYV